MENQNATQLTDVEQFLKVVDYLEAAVKNGNDEVAYYCRQYLEAKYGLEPMAEEEDAPANPAAPSDGTEPVDPNAQPAQPDPNASPAA